MSEQPDPRTEPDEDDDFSLPARLFDDVLDAVRRLCGRVRLGVAQRAARGAAAHRGGHELRPRRRVEQRA